MVHLIKTARKIFPFTRDKYRREGERMPETCAPFLAYGLPLSAHGKTVTLPSIPRPSCSTHLY